MRGGVKDHGLHPLRVQVFKIRIARSFYGEGLDPRAESVLWQRSGESLAPRLLDGDRLVCSMRYLRHLIVDVEVRVIVDIHGQEIQIGHSGERPVVGASKYSPPAPTRVFGEAR